MDILSFFSFFFFFDSLNKCHILRQKKKREKEMGRPLINNFRVEKSFLGVTGRKD